MLEKMPEGVGASLRSVRAGLDATVWADPALDPIPATLRLTSPAWAEGGPMPARFTADGLGLSPPLAWAGVPDGAAELLLLVEDADSPTPHPLVHAIAHGFPPVDGTVAEGAIGTREAGHGRNSTLRTGWLPPDPPPGHGPHRYLFQLYALPRATDRTETLGRTDVQRLVRTAIARGRLIATYERSPLTTDH